MSDVALTKKIEQRLPNLSTTEREILAELIQERIKEVARD